LGPALAHKASDEGIIAAEDAAGLDPHPLDYDYIPSATFCHPQVASFGLTEQQAKDAGHDVIVGKIPIGAVGAPVVYGDRGGMVKLVGDKQYGELLGGHIVCAKAADLIQELVNAQALEGGYGEVARTIHPHPTFAEAVMGISSPRVALLSNGEEPTKGTPELQAVHEQLAGSGGHGLNFVGNIEGTQVTESVADVVVMDGFTGNITLKLIEGVSGRTMRAIRDAAMTTTRSKLGGWLLRPAVQTLREEIDPEGPGGAYMLGLRQLGVVAHGRFTRRGFARAIEQSPGTRPGHQSPYSSCCAAASRTTVRGSADRRP